MLIKGARVQGWRPAWPPAEFEKGAKILAALILLVLIGSTLVVQLSVYPNHDVAWVLWGTRELLHGARWGRDIMEANPPLAWALAMPTTVLAEWTNLPLDWTFRAGVTLAGAVSAGSLLWLAPRHQSYGRSLVLCASAGATLLLLPGREFGQREQLLVIATLPYLALSALRFNAERLPSARTQLVIGVAAGIGVALKPYFVAVPLLVELCLQLLGKPKARFLRAENLAGAAVLVVYGCWLLAFEQPYLTEVVPLAKTIYWQYDLPLAKVVTPLVIQLLVAAPLMLLAAERRDGIGVMFGAAWWGFTASYLIQQKGYAYHLLPVTIMSLMLMANSVTLPQLRPLLRWAVIFLMAVFVWFICIPSLARWWNDNQEEGARTTEIDRVREALALHAPHGRWLVVAVHHHPAFPTAIYTPATYVSRTNSQWFLSAVVQIRQGQAAPPRAAAIERHAREFILHDLRARPDLVLIDTNSARHTMASRDFDFLAFYMEDPAFRSIWSSYEEIEPIGEFRQFVRVAAPTDGRNLTVIGER